MIKDGRPVLSEMYHQGEPAGVDHARTEWMRVQ
jgi:hypothetical protein